MTFNSEHDKSQEFDYPYLWDYMGIHYIYWLGFVQGIYPPNFTHVGVIPVKILHLKSFLLPSLANPHGDFFLCGGAFPLRKNNPYHTSNVWKKSLWEVKPYIMENIIGISSLYQI